MRPTRPIAALTGLLTIAGVAAGCGSTPSGTHARANAGAGPAAPTVRAADRPHTPPPLRVASIPRVRHAKAGAGLAIRRRTTTTARVPTVVATHVASAPAGVARAVPRAPVKMPGQAPTAVARSRPVKPAPHVAAPPAGSGIPQGGGGDGDGDNHGGPSDGDGNI